MNRTTTAVATRGSKRLRVFAVATFAVVFGALAIAPSAEARRGRGRDDVRKNVSTTASTTASTTVSSTASTIGSTTASTIASSPPSSVPSSVTTIDDHGGRRADDNGGRRADDRGGRGRH